VGIKFRSGNPVFKRVRAQREQQQRTRDRCKQLGITGPDDPKLGTVWPVIEGVHGPPIKKGWEPTDKPRVAPPDTSGEDESVPIASKAAAKHVSSRTGRIHGRYLTATETHDTLRQLFAALEREFTPQVLGTNGRQSFDVDVDRACQFAQRCLRGRAMAFWKND